MYKSSIIILIALAHVARSSDEFSAAAAHSAQSDTCKGAPYGDAQPGDRYCLNDQTNRVCNWGGVWVDFQCEEGSKCQVYKTDARKVQCFLDKRVGYPTGPPPGFQADAAHAAAAPDNANSGASSADQIQPSPNNGHADSPAQPNPSNAQVDSPAQPAQPPQTAAAQAPQPQAQPQPQPQPDQPNPTSTNTQPEQPSKALPAAEHRDCQGGLKAGETLCTGETTYKQCQDGQFVEDRCPEPAKCIKAADVNHIICREIRRNASTRDIQNTNDNRRRF